jgi:hypothetical protein
VLFGGTIQPSQTVDDYPADTWTWDGASWTEHKVAGPGPRVNAAAATLGGTVLFFSGTGPYGVEPSDTWTWDGASWTQRNVAGPVGRYSAAISSP